MPYKRKSMYIYLSGQKRGMTELECIWPVILTGECPKIISSPGIWGIKRGQFLFFVLCNEGAPF